MEISHLNALNSSYDINFNKCIHDEDRDRCEICSEPYHINSFSYFNTFPWLSPNNVLWRMNKHWYNYNFYNYTRWNPYRLGYYNFNRLMLFQNWIMFFRFYFYSRLMNRYNLNNYFLRTIKAKSAHHEYHDTHCHLKNRKRLEDFYKRFRIKHIPYYLYLQLKTFASLIKRDIKEILDSDRHKLQTQNFRNYLASSRKNSLTHEKVTANLPIDARRNYNVHLGETKVARMVIGFFYHFMS